MPEPQCLPIPPRWTASHAAAIPETFFTVWTNLFERGRLAAGERVLIHGGTSGIGTTAIQLARAFGAHVARHRRARTPSAPRASVSARRRSTTATTTSSQAVRDLTGRRGVDVVLDIVGGDYLPRNLECLAMDGRLVQIGLMGGRNRAINLRW